MSARAWAKWIVGIAVVIFLVAVCILGSHVVAK